MCEDLSRTVLLVAMNKSSQEEVAAAFSRVELRCHPSVVQAARELFSACRGVASAVRREEDVVQPLADVAKKRERFEKAARQEELP